MHTQGLRVYGGGGRLNCCLMIIMNPLPTEASSTCESLMPPCLVGKIPKCSIFFALYLFFI